MIEHKIYYAIKSGAMRCIESDRKFAEGKLTGDERIVGEIPCPYVKGRIFPNVSRFILSTGLQMDVVHIKPAYYLRADGQWRSMEEAFSYSGNKTLVLRQEYFSKGIIDFGYLGWLIKRCSLLHGSLVTDFGIPVMLNDVTSTFYPDPDPEVTSVDGLTAREAVDEAWGTIRGGAGNASSDAAAASSFIIKAAATTGNFQRINRFVYLFDTSSLPDSATIISATMSLFSAGVEENTLGGTPTVDVVQSSPASNTALVNSDFNIANWGTTLFAPAMDFATWDSTTDGTENKFALNADGITNISLTGVSKFGIMYGQDRSNTSPPSGTNPNLWHININFADSVGLTKDPKLVVVYAGGNVSTFLLMGVG